MAEIKPKHLFSKNGKAFEIRTAHRNDAARVIDYTREIMREAPYLLTTEDEFNLTITQQELLLQQMLDDNGKLGILAEYNDEIIGYLDFHNGKRERNKHQGSFGMSIRKEFRGQGIGKEMLSVLLDWAKDSPIIEKVCLDVFAENKIALQLYQNMGFVKEGIKTKAIKIDEHTYHDLFEMAYFT